MTIAAGIFLIAVGAIIRYALNFEIGGVDEAMIGLILMLAGLAILVLALVTMAIARRRVVTEERVDPRVDRPVDPRY